MIKYNNDLLNLSKFIVPYYIFQIQPNKEFNFFIF